MAPDRDGAEAFEKCYAKYWKGAVDPKWFARKVWDAALQSRPSAQGETVAGIYVASRVKHAPIWLDYRDRKGFPITATWIDEAGDGQTADFGELWQRIRVEIARSKMLVFFADGASDFPFKGALVEVGMALAMGKPVFAVLSGVMLEGRTMRPVGSWIADRNVRIFDTLAEAMSVAHGLSAAPLPAATERNEQPNAAGQRSTATFKAAPSQEGVGPGDAALAAPSPSAQGEPDGWTNRRVEQELYDHERPLYAYAAKGAGDDPTKNPKWRVRRAWLRNLADVLAEEGI